MQNHAEHRVLDYGADQMFALVADIEAYHEFLPWCAASRVTGRSPRTGGGEVLDADLVIAFRVFRETFSSRVTLAPETRRIDVIHIDGPFRQLENHWRFQPLGEGRCEVDFRVSFEFRSAILERLVGAVFQRAMGRVVTAFEQRAAVLYRL